MIHTAFWHSTLLPALAIIIQADLCLYVTQITREFCARCNHFDGAGINSSGVLPAATPTEAIF